MHTGTSPLPSHEELLHLGFGELIECLGMLQKAKRAKKKHRREAVSASSSE